MRLRNIPGAREEILDSAYVIQEPEKWKGKWREYFQKDVPVHIEIGMGKGQFLLQKARLNPGISYLGFEMYSSVLLRAMQKRQEYEKEYLSLGNLAYVRMDARLLPEVLEEEEVEKIYLNFSDPWPKSRHASRRLTSRRFLSRYEKILDKKTGVVEFKTDNAELFHFSLTEIREAGWELLYSTENLYANEILMKDNIATEYEEKFSSQGIPICKLAARPQWHSFGRKKQDGIILFGKGKTDF
ncbi:MAG: tRNA (guanosine(46)-N7)-methyltransferase TrmB [Blautia sp.]|nr:tRNA (guanosine(46)-N7)-methyltransferase TrmB [Blautia sp.]